jgi:hypothetical protein
MPLRTPGVPGEIRNGNFLNVSEELCRRPVWSVVVKVNIFWDVTPCRALFAICFHSGILCGLFFNPEDGGDIFFRNVGSLSTEYT